MSALPVSAPLRMTCVRRTVVRSAWASIRRTSKATTENDREAKERGAAAQKLAHERLYCPGCGERHSRQCGRSAEAGNQRGRDDSACSHGRDADVEGILLSGENDQGVRKPERRTAPYRSHVQSN